MARPRPAICGECSDVKKRGKRPTLTVIDNQRALRAGSAGETLYCAR
jgi:hypothetical protein